MGKRSGTLGKEGAAANQNQGFVVSVSFSKSCGAHVSMEVEPARMKLSRSIFVMLSAFLVVVPDSVRSEEPAKLQRGIDGERAELLKKLEEMRDFTKGVSDVCPVHKTKMPIKPAPIAYGLRFTDRKEMQDLINEKFPFSQEDISGGCLADNDPDIGKAGKRYVCPKCVAAWNQWLEEMKKKVESKK